MKYCGGAGRTQAGRLAMGGIGLELRVLTVQDDSAIMPLIREAFSAEPWNDRWEEEAMLRQYVHDIVGNTNSLALGLYEGERLIGAALGRLKHWFDGVEFCIDDLCICPDRQGAGAGTELLRLIWAYAGKRGFHKITLKSNRTAPAYQFYLRNGFTEMKDAVCFCLYCGE